MPISEYVAGLRAKIGTDLLMTPGVAAIIFNERREILLQLRSDNHRWGLPGGAVDPGEDPADAVAREVMEETGLAVEPVRIIGVYGGPSLVVTYPNGDQVAVTSIVFECRVLAGELRTDDDESLDLQYFPTDALPESFADRYRIRLEHALRFDSPAAFKYKGNWFPP